MGGKFLDRTGERHSRLLILSLHEKRPEGTSRWLARCDCGVEKAVSGRDLQRGHTRSCGCISRAALSAAGGQNKMAPGEASFRALFGGYKRSARARGLEFKLSEAQFKALVMAPCAYCHAPPTREYSAGPSTNGRFLANGVDRWENGIGYTAENCRPCCADCNMAKGAKTTAQWEAWLDRIVAARLRPIA